MNYNVPYAHILTVGRICIGLFYASRPDDRKVLNKYAHMANAVIEPLWHKV